MAFLFRRNYSFYSEGEPDGMSQENGERANTRTSYLFFRRFYNSYNENQSKGIDKCGKRS
jgi:hypothetical protein